MLVTQDLATLPFCGTFWFGLDIFLIIILSMLKSKLTLLAILHYVLLSHCQKNNVVKILYVLDQGSF